MKTENTNKRFMIALLIVVGMFVSNIGVTGLPPTTFSGFLDAVRNTAFNLFVPNNQATKTSTGILLETGNKNILKNPSFEHSTFNTGWTCSGTTPVEETSVVYDGKKSMKIAASSSTFECYQDSTLNAAYLASTQLLDYIRLLTTATGTSLKVCSRSSGVTSASNCIDVLSASKPLNNGLFNLLKLPTNGSVTSNGISIAGTSVTGNIYLDDSSVGAVDLKVDGDASRHEGSLRYVGTTSCFWSNAPSGTSWASFAATAACPAPSVSGAVVAPSTKIPGFVLNSTRGKKTVVINGILYNVSNGTDCAFKLTDGTNSSAAANIYGSASNVSGGSITFTIDHTTPGATYQIQSMSTGTCRIEASVINRQELNFEVYSTPTAGSSTYSSTNADTDWAACGHTTSSFTGFGTVTSIETMCKRQGSDLLVKGGWTSGTTTAVPGSFSLPLWNGVQLVTKGTSVVPTIQVAGKGNAAVAASTFFGGVTALIEPSATVVYIGAEASTLNGLSKTNASTFVSSGQKLSFGQIRIPIEGWENSNVIIAQLNGLESCTDSYQCTDTFSAKIAANGTVSDENIDWITGNCTTTSNLTCTFKTALFTTAPTCTISIVGNAAAGGGKTVGIISESATSINYSNTEAGAGNNILPVRIICQKAGADYIGKTAKAVASDQNVRMPGTTSAVIFGVEAGTTCSTSPCTLSKNYGGVVASTGVTRTSTGLYTVNFTGLTAAPICQVQIYPTINSTFICYQVSAATQASMGIKCQNTSTAVQDEGFTVSCMGVKP